MAPLGFNPSKPRPGWLTALDALLVLAGSAAVVALLGARTRLDLGGFRISIRAATNLLLASGALAIVRASVGGAVALFPAVRRRDGRLFDAERARLAEPAPVSPRVLIYAGATLLGSLVWIVPHLLHPRMVPDFGDPLFSAWRIARIAHQFTTDPRHLFDGNIFYPLPLTLTLSDSTFLQALLALPFVLAGADPLLVANVLTMAAFPACALASFYAAWRITGAPDAALIAGLLGAWYPFHAEHYSHLELQWVMFAPLAIVTGMRLLAAPRVRTGLAFGIAVAAQWLASMYLGVMLLSFAVFLPLYFVGALTRGPKILWIVAAFDIIAIAWRVPVTRRLVTASLAAAAIALPAFAGLAWPYVAARSLRGERARQEVIDGSATGADYRTPHERLVTYQRPHRHQPERELFPGMSTLVLATAGAVPPLPAAAIASLVAGSLAFDWSLGLNGLTYDELYDLSTVYRGMRMTARFSAIVGVALVVLGAIGAARVLAWFRAPRWRTAACAAIAILVLFDLRMDVRLQAYPRDLPAIYASVTPDMVLVELPVDRQIDYMYFSTRHWARLVGGYSGFPKYSNRLMDGWKIWPSPDAIGFFRTAGATHLTYNCALEDHPDRCGSTLEMLDTHPQLERIATAVWQGKETRLYRLR